MDENKLSENETRECKEARILIECEKHVEKILILYEGSTLINTIILLIQPIYLQKELNASASTTGIILFLTTGIYLVGSTSIPYIAESKTYYLENISYDNLCVIRLCLSFIVIILMALIPSIYAFAIFSILISLFNIGSETGNGSISLLLPNDRASKYIQKMVLFYSAIFILSAFVISATMAFFSYIQLFYLCAGLYLLLFIFSVKYVWNQESVLLTKQMSFFRKEFYVEKKRQVSKDLNLKYINQKDIEAIIAKSLRQKIKRAKSLNAISAKDSGEKDQEIGYSMEQNVDRVEHGVIEEDQLKGDAMENFEENSDASEITLDSQQKAAAVDFPIYDRSATEILQSDLESNASGFSRSKSQLFLTRRDWIVVCLAIIAYATMSIQWEIGSKWFVLYVITRFEGKSVSLSSMMIAILGLGGMIGVKLYDKFVIGVHKLIYNGVDGINTKQEVVINCCILLIVHSVLAIVSFIWKEIASYYYGICFMFVDGFVVHGITNLIPKLIIISVKTEHLEAKILAINYAFGWFIGSFGNLLMGFLWDISIDWFLYMMGVLSLMFIPITACIIGVIKSN